MSELDSKLDRRSFIKALGLTGATAAATLLPGCGPSSAPEASPQPTQEPQPADNRTTLWSTEGVNPDIPIGARFELVERKSPPITPALKEKILTNPDLVKLATVSTDVGTWLLDGIAEGTITPQQSAQFEQALSDLMAKFAQIFPDQVPKGQSTKPWEIHKVIP